MSAIPTWFFAVVLVRRGRRLLLVRERKHGQLWYLPAGRVEPGESLPDAARRETLEETGVPVVLEGIRRVEHSPAPDGSARVRVVFVARPADDSPPKSEPDQESLEARWVTREELDRLEVRGPDVALYFDELLAGAPVHPLSLLSPEGR